MKTLPAGGRLLVLDEATLRHLPPLRAAWAPRGKQAAVRISGTNARRSLFGTVDLRTGRRAWLVRKHQRLADYHAFLRRLRHGVGACGALWLLLGPPQQPSKPQQPAPWPKSWASDSFGCHASPPSSTRPTIFGGGGRGG